MPATEPRDLTVILADDSSAVVRELRALVDSIPGARVVATAGDGQTTLEAVETHRPDLLVLDVRMPRGNGLTVLKALSAMAGRPSVLMLSNTASAVVRRRALAAGADGYFDKSHNVAGLLREIRRRAPAAPIGSEGEA